VLCIDDIIKGISTKFAKHGKTASGVAQATNLLASRFEVLSELPKQKTLLCFFKFFAPHFFPTKAEKKSFCFGSAE
jgi:hypothetical protein